MKQSLYPVRPPSCNQLLERSPILQRYPVRAPLTLLLASAALLLSGFFSDALFPAPSLFSGLPIMLLCLSLACVLGICGALVGIITLIERVDQWYFQATVFSQTKEQSYANRN